MSASLLAAMSHGIFGGGSDCDYPSEDDVRVGTVFGDGLLVGTLIPAGYLLPDEASYSPADVLASAMINLGIGTDKSANADWPVLVNQEPTSPDNVLTTYDTVGQTDGRFQLDGDLWDHFGVSVRIRSENHPIGWVKAHSVRNRLALEVHDTVVTMGSITYKLNVSKVGNVFEIGKETKVSKRSLFTINLFVTLRIC